MQPLTHQVWERHSTELRPHVLEEFPKLDRSQLEAAGDDWDRVVELVQQSTGMSADLVAARLTSGESDLRAALMEVREDLWRQIDDAVNKRKERAR